MKKLYNCIKILVLVLFVLQTLMLQAQTQQYLHFDKVDDYVEIPNASQYIANSTEITMAGWYYCDALGYGQGMIAFRNGGSGVGEMYLIQLNNGLLECRFISTNGFHEVVTSNFAVAPQTWQHFAWVYNGSTVELFIDGVSAGSAAASGVIASTDTPLAIGKHISPFDFYYGGRVDEVSLWSKALTSTEIQDMMANELVGDEAGLELYYKFNQGVPGEDNTSISKLVSTVESGVRDGDLKNFALMGDASNFLGDVDNSFQAISFPQISNKLISDMPFDLEAEASSELTVNYEIVSGPASVSGNTVTLDGTVGEVVVKATQPGDGTYDPAEEVINSFNVLDPQTNVPITEIRSPLAGDVMVPELGPIQLAAISTINFTDLFSVSDVSFEIGSDVIPAVDWHNNHYTGWWTPPSYGTYTMNVVTSNNFGGTSTESVVINIVDQSSDMTVNAGDQVWLNVNVGSAIVEVELPSYVGAFDEIIGNLTITCPTGDCDPWDRISGIEVKGHNGRWFEIIRYITPYGVACNSTVDLTDFMSVLQGKIAFRFYLGTQGNGFEYTLDLDYNAGSPVHSYSSIQKLWYKTYDFGNPVELQPAETFNTEIQDNALAAKIKLVSTGHGWGDNNTGNAAEFHEDTHHIWVDGSETFEQHNWLVCNPNPDGCSPQNGTWFYDRAGWCPGTIAPWFDYDMTPYVDQNTVELQYVFDEDYVDLCNADNADCVSGVTCMNCNDGFNPHLIVASYLITLGDSPIADLPSKVNNLKKADLAFLLYPNPTSGMINLDLKEAVNQLEIRVLNNLGQTVKIAQENNAFLATYTIDLNGYPKGMYFVEVKTEKGSGVQKVLIE